MDLGMVVLCEHMLNTLCQAQVYVRGEAALKLYNGSCFIPSSSKLMLQSSAFGFSMGKGEYRSAGLWQNSCTFSMTKPCWFALMLC